MRRLGLVAGIAVMGAALAGPPAHAATIRSDFNADGFDDLAVSAPEENLPGGLNLAGVVNVIYGGGGGLTSGPAPQQLSASDLGGSGIRGGEFGWALDTGDFNDDGVADLAIGAHGEPVGPGTTGPRAGAVYVAFGGAAGLAGTGAQRFTQSDAAGRSEGFDTFGDSLAAGDFDGDGHDDLAVGAPGEALGTSTAPVHDAGIVNILYGTGAGGLSSARAQQLHQYRAAGRAEAGDLFGGTLAAGDLSGDGVDDLAIGTPDEDLGTTATPLDAAGVVNVLYGVAGGGLSSAGAQQLTQSQAAGRSEAEDGFGYRLAIGDLDGDGRDDLIASAAGEALGTSDEIDETGVVNVLFRAAGAPLGSGGARQINQAVAGGRVEHDDDFGRSLAIADFDGDGLDDLAIGSDGETLGTTATPIPFCGILNVLYGTGATQQFTQQQAGGTIEAEDRFGEGLAAADYDADGDADLTIGTYSEQPGSAGVINVMRSTGPGGLSAAGSRSITQSAAGGTAHAGELFGFALSSAP